MSNQDDLILRQALIEDISVTEGYAKYKDKVERQGVSVSHSGKILVSSSIEAVASALNEVVAHKSTGVPGKPLSGLNLLKELPAQSAAFLALRYILNTLSIHDVALLSAAKAIGSACAEHVEWEKLVKQQPYLARWYRKYIKETTNERHRRIALRKTYKNIVQNRDWDNQDRYHCGVLLLDLIVETTGLCEVVTERVGRRTKTIVRLTPEARAALDAIENDYLVRQMFRPRFAPCVLPPKPWTGMYDGGYHFKQRPFVATRTPGVREGMTYTAMPRVYEAVNVIQATPWTINEPVLNVARSMWQNWQPWMEQSLKLPSPDDPPQPVRPDILDGPKDTTAYKASVDLYRTLKKNWHLEVVRLASARYRATQSLGGAYTEGVPAQFRGDTIYFPHSLDFRGRIYPMTTVISPQGDQLSRAMLTFANGEVLTAEGLRWLKIHAANMFGVDKVSLEDREQWTDNNLLSIKAVADAPLDERWWTEADTPWSFLAACFELAGYCADPENFLSRLPVTVDGSCNGLQHYSALLRDPIGAAATNLLPSDTPADLYQQVADVAGEIMAQHLYGEDTEKRDFASVWGGRVTRKMCKRNAMTWTYGATVYGFQEQLKAYLNSETTHTHDLEDRKYLADVIREAIGQVVVAAEQGMDWLQSVAKAASGEDIHLRWTVPTGFRVHQHYASMKRNQVKAYIGGRTFKPAIQVPLSSVDSRKAGYGVAPNLVHSLDAAHLVDTVLRCAGKGISDVVVIHDSYGTHANHVDTLVHQLRASFVALYSGDVMQDVAAQLLEPLTPAARKSVGPAPAVGSLDIQRVLESDYFFA